MCQQHKEHVANFIMTCLTAKGRVPQRIILADPNDLGVTLENPALNTTECCQVCSISINKDTAGIIKSEVYSSSNLTVIFIILLKSGRVYSSA
jgi:hypothetical protein